MDPPPAAKRQKVNVACNSCRARKVKCNGTRPVCAPCEKRYGSGAECTWTAPVASDHSHAVTAEHVQQLEARIRELEAVHQLRSVDTNAYDPSPNSTYFEPSGTVRQATHSLFPSAGNPTEGHGVLPQPRSASISTPPHFSSRSFSTANGRLNPSTSDRDRNEATSANARPMHAIIGAVRDERRNQGFFGSSCAGRFMQQVKKAVEQKMESSDRSKLVAPNWEQRDMPLMAPGQDEEHSHTDYTLPPRSRADRLLRSYWTYVHTLYPYLDKPQTQAAYESLWVSGEIQDDERSFLCLLNIIFALSSQMLGSTASELREAAAAQFYSRAKELLDLPGTGSVRSVQTFLLFGQYLQSTNEPHQCWIYIGLAIRTAQSLGLHLPETADSVDDPKIRELLRRVWHGCVLMDRLLAMTYGRPSTLGRRAATSVPLPSSMDEEFVVSATGGSGQHGRKSPINFYIYSLKLYHILYEILVNFYSQEGPPKLAFGEIYERYFGRTTSHSSHLSVLEIDQQLVKWENSVPGYLKMSSYPEGHTHDGLFCRQATILYQRYLHVRLLLLRPVLSAFVTSDVHGRDESTSLGTLLSRQIILQSAIVCIRVAREAIDTVRRGRDASPGGMGDLGAWWYNVLFLYSSATVLIAACLSPTILAEMSEESVTEWWHIAIDMLNGYSLLGPSIRRLTTTLRLLFDTVPQQYQRLRRHSHQFEPEGTAPPDAGQMNESFAVGSHGATGYFAPSNHQVAAGDMVDKEMEVYGDCMDFDAVFDPNDLSWFTTVPFEI